MNSGKKSIFEEAMAEDSETKIVTIKRHNWRPLTGGVIKMIGLVLMVMDHLHQMFLTRGVPEWFTWFGRPVAAMFLFLCAEGFYYTRSRKRYMLHLLAGFLFMTAVNMLLSHLAPIETVNLTNNIFGTLFMAVFYMWMIDILRGGVREKKPRPVLLAIGGMLLPLAVGAALLFALSSQNRPALMVLLFIPNPVTVEGGIVLVLMGVLFYLLRNIRFAELAVILAVSVLAWFSTGDAQWLMVTAVVPVFLYNGQRGRGNKYFFYIFYPAHIYLFYIIAWFLARSTGLS
ncbi:MAG: conjugal transfer protein TraX [Spirochaetaceae bacterium]|jgi:hypothetical protein|nr:conjugal transfer protein TraX [Spirochaetaceae bacterium]